MRRFLAFIILSAGFLTGIPSLRAAETQNQPVVFGAPQDTAESRLSPYGILRPFPDSFEIVPVIEFGTQWLSAAQAERHFSYKEDHLPLPSAIWNFQGFRLETEALAWGPPEHAVLRVRYHLRNKEKHAVQGKIHFLLKSVHENPVYSIEYSEEGRSVRVNGTQTLFLSDNPSGAGFLKAGQESLMKIIKRHDVPQIHSVKDPEGNAAGAWTYPFKIEALKKSIFEIIIPLHPDGTNLKEPPFKEVMIQARTFWRRKLNRLSIKIADSGMEESIYHQMAALFILRDHPGFYPENRVRGESWTANTLRAVQTYMDYGYLEEAREDLEMAALCADASGEIHSQMKEEELAGSMKEYGLQGKFITAVWNYYRLSKDKTWLSAKWEQVKETLRLLKRLRAQRLTDWYAADKPERKQFYGILPPSRDPTRGDFEELHRYEDSLLAVKAFKDGQKMAVELDFPEDEEWMKTEEWTLRRAMLDSIARTSSRENIRFIPLAPEKAVMMPWPGTVAVWPADEALYFPQSRMEDHFRNIKEIFERSKISDPEKAALFSGFEVIQAFLRRGEKETARAMFRFQYDRLGSEDVYKTTGFLKTVRDFFVYESSGKLILGAGVLPVWAESENGLQIKLPTFYGEIKYSMRPVRNGWHVHAEGNANPPEGFVFHAPSGKKRQIFRRLPVDFEIQD